MDASNLIVQALVAGLTAAAEPAVKDAYAALKQLLLSRYGDRGDLAPSVEQVARKPKSPGRQKVLAEELASTGADQDADLARAAQDLLGLVKSRGEVGSRSASATHGSAAATQRGVATVGDGNNIALTGDIQGGVTIIQGGTPLGMATPTPSPAADLKTDGPSSIPSPRPAAVRDLLLAAFTADDLRRLFLYTENPDLRPLSAEFASSDGLVDMVDKAVEYCDTRALLPDLLREVQRANPRQYARFAQSLRG